MEGVPPIQFAIANNSRIAYQMFGDGDATIVAIPPMAQNIEVGWEQPEIRSMLEWFGSFTRYVHFDKRGTGASDRARLVPGIDERVDDLKAVMDAAGVDRAHLFAQSEGGPTTLLFAATYPHRVESVILLGSAARMVDDDLDVEVSLAARQLFADLWGTPDSMVVDLFAPSKSANDDFRAWHQRYERLAASSDSLYDMFIQMMDMDVRDVVPMIDAPILVIHRTGDRAMPLGLAKEVVDLASNGTFVEIEGEDHFAYLGDTELWMRPLATFITGAPVTVPALSSGTRTVSIRTLGRFAVEVDGVEVPNSDWGSRRSRTLLKRLVVARGWPVTRDQLADVLWPDETDAGRLGARLSVQLSTVRRVLGGGVLADRQTVSLDLTHVSVDVEELLGAENDAGVLELYEGDFLGEERYEDWASPLREEARTRFTVAAHRHLSALRAAGENSDASKLARRLIKSDPYDVAATESLALTLEALGDPAAAVRARRDLAELLDDLGEQGS